MIKKTYLLLRIISIITFLLIILLAITGCSLYYQHHTDNIPEPAGDIVLSKKIIDGDTFVTDDGMNIRLLGINAPERDSYYYNESTLMLEYLIEGKELVLEEDVETFDQYGRYLAYVYSGEIFINLEMVKRGFANVYTNPPNVEYVDEFLEAERYARRNEMGLWKKSGIENIIISIEYDAEGDDRKNLNGEFVLIKNDSDGDIDISGWTVKDSGRNEYVFRKGYLVEDEFIYLFTGEGTDSLNMYYWNSPTPVWNNDHDTMYLRDEEGLLVGIYNY